MNTLRCRAVRLRGSRWLQASASGWALALMLLGSCAVTGAVGSAAAVLPSLLLALVVHRGLRALAERKRAGGDVSLQRGGLLVHAGGGDPVNVARERVVTAYEDPTTHAAVLVLDDGREIALTFDEEGPVDAVLEHLGFGPAQRSITLPLRGLLGAGTWALVGGMLGFLAAIYLWGAFGGTSLVALTALVTPVLCAVLLARWLGRPRVTIGADGLRVSGPFGERFVRYADVQGVVTFPLLQPDKRRNEGSAIRVTTKRRVYDLPLYGESAKRARAIQHRIERASASSAAGQESMATSLGRAGRPLDAWRTELSRVASTHAGFRDAAIGATDFARVLADASAPVDERVGAALALRVAAPDEAPAAIQGAIEASADETLRSGLAAALAEDEAALDEATRRGS